MKLSSFTATWDLLLLLQNLIKLNRLYCIFCFLYFSRLTVCHTVLAYWFCHWWYTLVTYPLMLMFYQDVCFSTIFFLLLPPPYFTILTVPHYTPSSSGLYSCRLPYRRCRAGVRKRRVIPTRISYPKDRKISYRTVPLTLTPLLISFGLSTTAHHFKNWYGGMTPSFQFSIEIRGIWYWFRSV